MHKAGKLDPQIAKAAIAADVALSKEAVKQRKKLYKEMVKEGDYYSSLRKKVLKGKVGPTTQEYNLDCSVMKAGQRDIDTKITEIEKVRRSLRAEGIEIDAKAVDYVTPDGTPDTTLDSSDVFTEDEEEILA